MSWGMSFLLAFLISTAWLYLNINYTAFKDGCRNNRVMKAAWWPCANSNNVNYKMSLLKSAMEVHATHEELHVQAFALDCAIVIRNNIYRRHSHQVDITNLKYKNIAFEKYVDTFNKTHRRSTES